jgi:hypothetical protein
MYIKGKDGDACTKRTRQIKAREHMARKDITMGTPLG